MRPPLVTAIRVSTPHPGTFASVVIITIPGKDVRLDPTIAPITSVVMVQLAVMKKQTMCVNVDMATAASSVRTKQVV